MSKANGCVPFEGDEGTSMSGRITPAQVKELRKLMVWSEGEGLDAATISDLLDEVEWLQAELASARRLIAGTADSRAD